MPGADGLLAKLQRRTGRSVADLLADDALVAAGMGYRTERTVS